MLPYNDTCELGKVSLYEYRAIPIPRVVCIKSTKHGAFLPLLIISVNLP